MAVVVVVVVEVAMAVAMVVAMTMAIGDDGGGGAGSDGTMVTDKVAAMVDGRERPRMDGFDVSELDSQASFVTPHYDA